MPTEEHQIWRQAAAMDPMLAGYAPLLPRLARQRVWPQPFSRETLFGAVAAGKPCVLTGYQVPVPGARGRDLKHTLAAMLARSFRQGGTVNAQVGKRHVRRRLQVPELMRRWGDDRHTVSVTDLHVRGTPIERAIGLRQLSAFNLLPLGTEPMQRQEMMTLVVSSRGNVTDSHSDDPDGSNHCFIGKKLWLGWETFEGQRAGLQDCSRDMVNERATFDLTAFCGLKSACWWTVGPGETLFLPGRLSHRVITLERYMGIGSFYVTPASCLDSLSRWYVHQPLWSLDDPRGDNDGLVDCITRGMLQKLRRLACQSNRFQRQWGLDFAPQALRTWQTNWTARQRRQLLRHPPFAELVNALQALSPA